MNGFNNDGGWTEADYFGTDGKWHYLSDENGQEWLVNDATGWDPIMGDDDEWLDTDDEWLDDFQGEEDWG